MCFAACLACNVISRVMKCLQFVESHSMAPSDLARRSSNRSWSMLQRWSKNPGVSHRWQSARRHKSLSLRLTHGRGILQCTFTGDLRSPGDACIAQKRRGK